MTAHTASRQSVWRGQRLADELVSNRRAALTVTTRLPRAAHGILVPYIIARSSKSVSYLSEVLSTRCVSVETTVCLLACSLVSSTVYTFARCHNVEQTSQPDGPSNEHQKLEGFSPGPTLLEKSLQNKKRKFRGQRDTGHSTKQLEEVAKSST